MHHGTQSNTLYYLIFQDSNASSGNLKDVKGEWSYYDDMFPEGNEDGFNSDSDFEYEDSYTKKKSKGSAKKGGKIKASSLNLFSHGATSFLLRRTLID